MMCANYFDSCAGAVVMRMTRGDATTASMQRGSPRRRVAAARSLSAI
jgi:hypothetical protein